MITLPHVPNAIPHVRAYVCSRASYKFNLNRNAKFTNSTTTPQFFSADRRMEYFDDAPRFAPSSCSFSAVAGLLKFLSPLNLRKPYKIHYIKKLPSQPSAMESCPKKEIPNFKEMLQEENFYLTTEAGEQGRLPVLLLKLKETSPRKRPAIVFLHSTNKCKEWLRPLLEAYASRDYISIAVDSRYHGERARNLTTYRDALVSSWKKGDTMPFIFDTVWDLIKLADYLTQREDVDPSRIGITGESLGGMHAWFGAAADTRYSVAVPIIGVQGFRWSIEHDKWQLESTALRLSLKFLVSEARIDLGKSTIDKEVVEKVWDRIAPGLASRFDSPCTVPAIAPRPLLILNGKDDPRCPVGGLELPYSRARETYEQANSSENFKLVTQPGIGHQMTPLMLKQASEWFDQHFTQ